MRQKDIQMIGSLLFALIFSTQKISVKCFSSNFDLFRVKAPKFSLPGTFAEISFIKIYKPF